MKTRAAEIAEREEKLLLERTPASAALHGRALRSLPNGVASNFQANDPYPIYLKRGHGSRVWDVDETEYIDFHGGFGVNVVGHAHPKIVEAIRKVADRGIHFAVTTEATVALAEEICYRFQLDQMRFVNSGTEATMDAVRVARAATGRDRIVKMEGSYHGHHDCVLFSVVPESDVLGTAQRSVRRTPGPATPPSPRPRACRALGHRHRPVQRCQSSRGSVRRARERDRCGDPGAGDDEHRHRGSQVRLPEGAPRPLRRQRGRADLRRGQVRRDDRLRRGHRTVRRAPASGGVRQGHRGWRDDRCVRRRGS